MPNYINNGQGKANISFYRIPFDGERRQRWVAAISRKDWQPSKYSRICSEHFLPARLTKELHFPQTPRCSTE
uniref:THAP-type domain-containing protein n=1 Tax=Paramormyrops kingsleyae TaxID=1676925 RepID=A0A3B3SYW9_9TELE